MRTTTLFFLLCSLVHLIHATSPAPPLQLQSQVQGQPRTGFSAPLTKRRRPSPRTPRTPRKPRAPHSPLTRRGTIEGRTSSKFIRPRTKAKKPVHRRKPHAPHPFHPAHPRQPQQLIRRQQKAPPSSLAADIDSEPLLDQNHDEGYTATINLGTPPRPFQVVLDTGSSDLFVAGTGCRNYEGNNPYDPEGSTTFDDLERDFSIHFGVGSATGVVVQDTLEWSGFNITNQVFAVATSVSGPQVISGTADGLIGLALSGIAETKSTPFLEALFRNNKLPEPLFAISLARNINNTTVGDDAPGGQIDIGYTNSSVFSGEIDYSAVPAGLADFWTIPLLGLSLDSEAITLSTNNQTAMIDSGTTLITGPMRDVAAMYDKIPGSRANDDGSWSIPCDTSSRVAFTFGTKTWSIEPADFVIADDEEGFECTGAIEGSDGGSPYDWLLGDAFMKNVYSVFRFDPPSVGFAAVGSGGVDNPPPPAVSSSTSTGSRGNGSGGSGSSVTGGSPNTAVKTQVSGVVSVVAVVMGVIMML